MRKKKVFLVAMIAVLMCIFTLKLPVFADVGDFETKLRNATVIQVPMIIVQVRALALVHQ